MHILSLVGNAPYYDEAVKSGKYSRGGLFTDVSVVWTELAGKTIGVTSAARSQKLQKPSV